MSWFWKCSWDSIAHARHCLDVFLSYLSRRATDSRREGPVGKGAVQGLLHFEPKLGDRGEADEVEDNENKASHHRPCCVSGFLLFGVVTQIRVLLSSSSHPPPSPGIQLSLRLTCTFTSPSKLGARPRDFDIPLLYLVPLSRP